MKIPKTFVLEKNLEEKLRNLLESVDNKRQEEALWLDYRKVDTTPIVYHENWTNNKLRIKITNYLQIRSDYSNDLHVTINIPIINSVYEKSIGTSGVESFIQSKNYTHAVNKAMRRMKKLKEHFDFDKLISKVQTDSELFSKIDDIFKEYPPRDYDLEFQENGRPTLKGYNIFGKEEYNIFGEEHNMLCQFYKQYISKYLPKGLKKGFLYSLRIGLQNLF